MKVIESCLADSNASVDSLKLDSAALARVIAEVRNDAVSAPTAYNRVHNRHNR